MDGILKKKIKSNNSGRNIHHLLWEKTQKNHTVYWSPAWMNALSSGVSSYSFPYMHPSEIAFIYIMSELFTANFMCLMSRTIISVYLHWFYGPVLRSSWLTRLTCNFAASSNSSGSNMNQSISEVPPCCLPKWKCPSPRGFFAQVQKDRGKCSFSHVTTWAHIVLHRCIFPSFNIQLILVS